MSAPSTPVSQIRVRRATTPPRAPLRVTRGVSPGEARVWDALVSQNAIPLLTTPVRSSAPSGGSPLNLQVTGLPLPVLSTPVARIPTSGLPLAPARRPRVRSLEMASINWNDEDEESDNEELLMTPPPTKRFRYE